MEAMSPASTSMDLQFKSYKVLLENTSFSDPFQDTTTLPDMFWNGQSSPFSLFFFWKHSYNCHRHVIEKQAHHFHRVTSEIWDLIVVDSLFAISGMVIAQRSSSPYVIFIPNPVDALTPYYMNLEWSTVVQPPLFLDHDKASWTEKSFWDRLYSVEYNSLTALFMIGPIQWLKYKCSNFGWRSFYDHSIMTFRDSLPHMERPMPLSNQLLHTANCPSRNKIKPLAKTIKSFVSDPNSAGTIVVAFGTMVNWALAPKHKLLAMVDALKSLSDYRIIWAYKGNFQLELPNHIKIMSWIPQIDLLNHNRTKLLVTHGGIKSVKESICAEIPAVFMPIFAEQLRNSFLATRVGLGEYVNKKNLTDQYVLGQMLKVLSNKNYYENVKRLKYLMIDNIIDPLDNGVFGVNQIIKRKGLPRKYFKLNQKKCLMESLNLDIFLVIFMFVVVIFS